VGGEMPGAQETGMDRRRRRTEEVVEEGRIIMNEMVMKLGTERGRREKSRRCIVSDKKSEPRSMRLN
jgi:hypothetical protein